ncbi:MAG: phospholipid carrier-dependent glycosyltransferase [Actinomycetota bacterium]|nr:phospholipid carrier-dependent glycosyltransferase [Actinomycetota bacterium]
MTSTVDAAPARDERVVPQEPAAADPAESPYVGPVVGRTPAQRLRPLLPTDRWWGWLGPGLVTALAGFLSFNRLSRPHGLMFDEVYYAKDAYALLRHGYELNGAGDGPGFVVHPPLGKWLIALGEAAFGNNELGWRFSAAVVGTLSVLILARTARRLTGSTLLGCFAGLLLSLDGLHFVSSRISMLDIFLMFWVTAGFACLVADRDLGRARLARALSSGRPVRPAGPRLGVRWWRLAAGGSLGAACATKWSGVYYVAAFGLLAFAWEVGARRTAGVRAPVRAVLRREAASLLAFLAVVPVVVYLAAWTGWFATGGGWDRHWAAGHGTVGGGVAALRGLWHYHAEALHFHANLSSHHPYQSHPEGWLLLERPVAYFYTAPRLGELGCAARDGCSRAVLGIGTPAVWWVSILALVAMLWLWLARRDWRAAAILGCVSAGIAPWLATPKRTMFLFYALPTLPFLILALTLSAGLVLGTATAGRVRRAWGAAVVGGYALLVTANFFYLYPILSAKVIPYAAWYSRMWFKNWI